MRWPLAESATRPAANIKPSVNRNEGRLNVRTVSTCYLCPCIAAHRELLISLALRHRLPARRHACRSADVLSGLSTPCRKDFTVTMGTVMERSHIPLHKWLRAFHLMYSSK